jgi:predicted HicB family RNase H-like nuclease
MNSTHRKTLAAVFTDPVSGTIRMGGNRKPAAGRKAALAAELSGKSRNQWAEAVLDRASG